MILEFGCGECLALNVVEFVVWTIMVFLQFTIQS